MIIAIDGYSSCGKSTLAKQLADTLDIKFVDTGAMYRSITLYFIRQGVDLQDKEAIREALKQITISFQRIDGKNVAFLNGENIEKEIRSASVSALVSPVATIPEVREFLVSQQREMGKDSLVMDGRDIGTVVFPNADFKFFITSSLEVRVNRRLADLSQRGITGSFEEVEENLLTRDKIDSSREHSPLRRAPDAILIDNTLLSREEQLQLVLHHIRVFGK